MSRFVQKMWNGLTKTQVNNLIKNLKKNSLFENHYLNKSKALHPNNYAKLAIQLKNSPLNASDIHLLGDDIINTLYNIISELIILKGSDNKEFLKKYQENNSNSFLNKLKEDSQTFNELDGLLNIIGLSLDLDPLIKSEGKNKTSTFVRENNNEYYINKKRLNFKHLHERITLDYYEAVKDLPVEAKLKLGIISIPGRSISDLNKLLNLFNHSDSHHLNNTKLFLEYLTEFIKLYYNWSINNSPLDIINNSAPNFLSFLSSSTNNNNNKKNKFFISFLNTQEGKSFLQLIDSLFTREFIDSSNKIQTEEITIITNSISHHILGSYVIRSNKNSIDYLGTINNLIKVIDNGRIKSGTTRLLLEICTKNTFLTNEKLKVGLACVITPFNIHQYWKGEFHHNNITPYLDRAIILGSEPTIFVKSSTNFTVNGMPDKPFKGLFSNNRFAIEYKVPSSSSRALGFKYTQFKNLNDIIAFNFSSGSVIVLYNHWNRNNKIPSIIPINETLKFLKFIHTTIFSELIGYPKVLHIDDTAKIPRSNVDNIDIVMDKFFINKTDSILFVNKISTSRMSKIKNFIETLAEDQFVFLMDKFGYIRSTDKTNFIRKNVEAFKNEGIKVKGEIRTSFRLNQNTITVNTDKTYAYHLQSISDWYNDVLHLPLREMYYKNIINDQIQGLFS